MGLFDGFRWLLGREAPHERESIEDLIGRLGLTRTNPWRRATTSEALGVPAVFKAVSLISNTVGTLSMEAYRQGAKLDAIDTPRLIVRPNPFTTPRVFWRDSAFYMARLGEMWWWTAKRDVDGQAISLVPVDPREIVVTPNPRNELRPRIQWRETTMPNDDMTQVTYLPDPNNPLRGWGPLQACGAAVSVAVEAQEYAANFFAGSPATTWIKSALDVDEDEAADIKAAWISGASGLPKVTGPAIEDVKDVGVSPEQSQLSDTRLFQNGEVSLMFSIPPTLLNYAVSGSTLTYQNIGQVADDFLRQCLLPHYLEPMEQAMSDLLTRQTVGRFNTGALLRPDPKTRADIYNILVPLGVMSVEEAQAIEGFVPGDVENRPVPFAAPQAIPASLPVQLRDRELRDVRCPKCSSLHTRSDGYVDAKCRRCGTTFSDGPAPQVREAAPPPIVHIYNQMPALPAFPPPPPVPVARPMRIIRGENGDVTIGTVESLPA